MTVVSKADLGIIESALVPKTCNFNYRYSHGDKDGRNLSRRPLVRQEVAAVRGNECRAAIVDQAIELSDGSATVVPTIAIPATREECLCVWIGVC